MFLLPPSADFFFLENKYYFGFGSEYVIFD